MDTLHVVIMHPEHLEHLEHHDHLVPVPVPVPLALHQLALRHLDWQVRPEHYDRVGEARDATLAENLGEHFTPALREAWRVAYPHESCAG